MPTTLDPACAELAAKGKKILAAAQVLFDARPSWVTFYREIFGVTGEIQRALFGDTAAYEAFERTAYYARLREMLAELQQYGTMDGREPNRVVTARMPKSVYDALREEARRRRTSMNQLVISKILQPLRSTDIVPDQE